MEAKQNERQIRTTVEVPLFFGFKVGSQYTRIRYHHNSYPLPFPVRTTPFISSISAHFVHRYFTFDERKDVRHTAIGALSVYAFGLVGSTLTFDSLVILSELPIRLIFLLNVCAWGIFTWGMMKWMVFGYIDESEE